MANQRKNSNYKTGNYISKKTGLLMRYRSSWEFEFMKSLDLDNRVYDYRYELIEIPYMLESEDFYRKYIPDFIVQYIDGSLEIIEIKPSLYLEDEDVVAKKLYIEKWILENFKLEKVKYIILTEKDLFNSVREKANGKRRIRKSRKKTCLN